MRIKIKVCGMRDPANITDVAEMHPDFMGFNFYESSPRFVGPHFRLPALPASIKAVGVFVNASFTTIARLAREQLLTHVQLHGHESPELCAVLKTSGLRVIKAFPLEQPSDLDAVALYENAVDYFLFDSKGPGYGGNGITFDWNLLDRYPGLVPFFLGGGIGPENIGRVAQIRNPRLFAVDLNSRVETAPGIKDLLKLKQVIDSLSTQPI